MIEDDVLNYFRNRKRINGGFPVSARDIARGTGHTPKQVRDAIYRIQNKYNPKTSSELIWTEDVEGSYYFE